MDSSPWRRHDDIDAQNNIDAHGSTDVIAAIESMATAAINSIQAAGAAARSATELPQLTVNDGGRSYHRCFEGGGNPIYGARGHGWLKQHG